MLIEYWTHDRRWGKRKSKGIRELKEDTGAPLSLLLQEGQSHSVDFGAQFKAMLWLACQISFSGLKQMVLQISTLITLAQRVETGRRLDTAWALGEWCRWRWSMAVLTLSNRNDVLFLCRPQWHLEETWGQPWYWSKTGATWNVPDNEHCICYTEPVPETPHSLCTEASVGLILPL